MLSLLDKNLLVVTGKGGVGKTTVAAALGLLASQRGLRTIICEVGEHQRLPVLFGAQPDSPGQEQPLAEGLWCMSVDPRHTLAEWLRRQLGSRAVARLLLGSDTFEYIVAAAPGASEVVAMGQLWELIQPERWDRRAQPYDLVIMDAPASGHALAMLRTPTTYATIVRVGPIARQARLVQGLLEDPERTAVLAVAQAAELPVSETLEIDQRLRPALGRGLETVVVNATLPRRFSRADLRELDDAGEAGGDPRVEPARRAARSAQSRWSEQHGQLGRLRRELDAPIVTLPFIFSAHFDAVDLEALARTLERRL